MTTITLPFPDASPTFITTSSLQSTQSSTTTVQATIHFGRVINDFEAEGLHEVALQQDDIIKVVEFTLPDKTTSPKGLWLFGKNNGQWGWLPANHVVFLTDEESQLEKEFENLEVIGQEGYKAWSGMRRGGDDHEEEEEGHGRRSMDSLGVPSELSSGDMLTSGEVTLSSSPALSNISTAPTSSGPRTPNRHASDSEDNEAPRRWKKFMKDHQIDRYESKIHGNDSQTTLQNQSTPRTSTTSMGSTPSPLERVPTKFKALLSRTSKPEPNPPSRRSTTRASVSGFTRGPETVGAPMVLDPTWKEVYGAELIEKLGLSAKDVKRQNAIYEFELSERRYMENMRKIVENIYQPLKDQELLRPKDLDIVFANLPEIAMISQVLADMSVLAAKWELKRLFQTVVKIFENARQENKGYIPTIGKLFTAMTPWLKLYALYCGNHGSSCKKLAGIIADDNPASRFISEEQKQGYMDLKPLSSYLLEPMQRICRYPLLLQNVLNQTEETHEDYESTDSALKIACAITKVADQGEKSSEAAEEMIRLQKLVGKKVNVLAAHRDLIARLDQVATWTPTPSTLYLLVGPQNKPEPRCLFLFNDMILIATPKVDSNGALVRYTQTDKIPLKMVLINVPADGGDLTNLIEIVHIGTRKYLLRFPSPELKHEWLGHLEQAASFYVQRSKLAQEPVAVVQAPEPVMKRGESMIVRDGVMDVPLKVELPIKFLVEVDESSGKGEVMGKGEISTKTLMESDFHGPGGRSSVVRSSLGPSLVMVDDETMMANTASMSRTDTQAKTESSGASVSSLRKSLELLIEEKKEGRRVEISPKRVESPFFEEEKESPAEVEDLDGVIVKEEVTLDVASLPFMKPSAIKSNRGQILSPTPEERGRAESKIPRPIINRTPQRLTRSIENLSSASKPKRPSIDETPTKSYRDVSLDSLPTKPFVRTLVKSLDNLASTPTSPSPTSSLKKGTSPTVQGSTPILSFRVQDNSHLPPLPQKPAPKVPGQKPLVAAKPAALKGYKPTGYGYPGGGILDGTPATTTTRLRTGEGAGMTRLGSRSTSNSRDLLAPLEAGMKMNPGLTSKSRISSNPFIVQDVGSVRGGAKRSEVDMNRSVLGGGHARAATAEVIQRQATVGASPKGKVGSVEGLGGGSGSRGPSVQDLAKGGVGVPGGVHARARTHEPNSGVKHAPKWQPQILPVAASDSMTSLRSASRSEVRDKVEITPSVTFAANDEPSIAAASSPTSGPPEAGLPKRAKTIQARMRDRRRSSSVASADGLPGGKIEEEVHSGGSSGRESGVGKNAVPFDTERLAESPLSGLSGLHRDGSLSDLVRLLEGGL
ncbi:Intersectin 1 (SH3 domain protein), partial [Rhizophlyctis rosea]